MKEYGGLILVFFLLLVGFVVGLIGAVTHQVSLPVALSVIMFLGLFKPPHLIPEGTGGIYLIWSACFAWITYGITLLFV